MMETLPSGVAATRANCLDKRSLALFRILLGLYLLYDIYARTSLGKYDLAWYTSLPPSRSFLSDLDFPHQAPLHKLWFYRGTLAFQVAMFGISTLLAVFFTVGLFQQTARVGGLVKTVLFIVQVAQQSRNMPGTDGSDSFLRHLLFWSCFLPLVDVWSVDEWRASRRKHKTKKPSHRHWQCTGLPCLGLILQIAFMYLGTALNRIDVHGWKNWHQCEWLPPSLSAVHYALSGSFATRDNFLGDLIRTQPILSKTMTAMAMVGEIGAPIGCVLGGKYRHWFALVLFQMHLGLFLTLNLPNWQPIGMLIQVLFIPTAYWDRWLGFSNTDEGDYKKTDGDSVENTEDKDAVVKKRSASAFSRTLQIFFLSYMIYNWLGNRGWIAKHDRGDIGEGLRLSQYWVMYGTLGHVSDNIFLTGYIDTTNETSRDARQMVDLLHYVKTKTFRDQDDFNFVPLDMTSRFPSPRWERALHQWAAKRKTQSARLLCQVLCLFVNEDRTLKGLPPLASVEMRWQHMRILPPGSKDRYPSRDVSKVSTPDTIISAPCMEYDSSFDSLLVE